MRFKDRLEEFMVSLRMQGWVIPPFKLPAAFYHKGPELVVECSRLLEFRPEIWRQTLNCLRAIYVTTTEKEACKIAQQKYKELVCSL